MRVTLTHVTKKFGRQAALDDVCLSIPAGQIISVIGLNGAGKTTLLRALAGIVAPSRGEISYDSEPFNRGRLDLRRRLMFLPDFPVLYAGMDALDHIALMLRIYERETHNIEDRIVAALGELDLLPLAKIPLGNLSRGQIYKAALTGLFAVQPELWLLDEPFASGMDPQGLATLKKHARAAAAQGTVIIYSTQILEIAERFCDRLCVLDRGRLRADFSRGELDAMPRTGPESIEDRLGQFREISP